MTSEGKTVKLFKARPGVLVCCALAATLALSACSVIEGEKIDYKSAGKGVSLEVPPDLTQLSRDSRYQIPGGTVTASAYQVGQAAPDLPTAATSVGDVRIEKQNARVYVPIVSMLLISILFSVLSYVLRRIF